MHRDIKPHNIILGDDGLPRLVDFGVAVPVASEAVLHLVAGSPPYMAPEQARGQGERVNARTDVYGLGAVLYYLLTGLPPHDGDTVKDVIVKAQGAPVVPPRDINRRVPQGLARICLKAMAADPQARFQSADALRRELRRYQRMRQAAPALAAAAILLALLVPAWGDLAAVVATVTGPDTREHGRGLVQQPSEPPPPPLAIVRVTRFEISISRRRMKINPTRRSLWAERRSRPARKTT